MIEALVNIVSFLVLVVVYRIILFSLHLICGMFGLYKNRAWAFIISILAAGSAMVGSISSAIVLAEVFYKNIYIVTYLAFAAMVLYGAFNNAQRLWIKAKAEGADTINPNTGLTAAHARLISQGTFAGAFLGLVVSYVLFFSLKYPIFGFSFIN